MSKHRKAKLNVSPVATASPATATLAPSAQSKFPHVAVLVLLVTGIVIAFGYWWFALRPAETKAAATLAAGQAVNSPATAAGQPENPAAAAAPRPDFQKLVGRWLRPDGGYVLDVKNIAADGRIDMAYLNPKSIHVAQAQVRQDGKETKVFIELRDVNYPGSTYNLIYSPEKDVLYGIYFQALERHEFDVYFVRMK